MSAIAETRQQVQRNKQQMQTAERSEAVNLPQYHAPRSRAEVDAYLATLPHVPAAHSIAMAHALFESSYKRNKVRKAYNALTLKQRAMCCIAGDLDPKIANVTFDQLNDIERQKVRRGLDEMNKVTKRFECEVGNVSQLKAPDFL
ncbi:hypothetical protein [Vibrio cholerae]|uniref:hypothetical protein n=1 Tax=Vibrio cholerae TaxID=666 RepID=UPI0015824969|nr:hypothetical protein [Vibrio cholerae]EIF5160643.1 hypothetical protein [Vibrio cholerae]EKF9168483.1 hypothetical protein [Vibrio cholerae]QKU57306.1 hypothetical protein HPY04_14580 [Vibrio cholerae]